MFTGGTTACAAMVVTEVQPGKSFRDHYCRFKGCFNLKAIIAFNIHIVANSWTVVMHAVITKKHLLELL